MASFLQMDREYIREILGPDVTFASPDDVSSVSSDDDIEKDLVTLHNTREEDFARHSRMSAAVVKKPGSSHLYTPPTSSQPDPAKARELALRTFDKYQKLNPCDYAEPGTQFCHWSLVEMYPHAYIGKTNRAKAAYLFEEILNGFVWDFFYLYNPRNHRMPAKLFVPTEQLVRFLDYVNATIGIQLSVPDGPPGFSFQLTFGVGGCHGPRYAGRTTQKPELTSLIEGLPDFDELDAYKDAGRYGVEDIINKLNARGETGDKDKEGAARKREGKTKRKLAGIQLVQHLLGLRPEGQGQRLDEDGHVIMLDVGKSIPFKPYEEVVLIAIDIEVNEEAHGDILEIGVATLDTKDLAGVAPGENGKEWFPLIKAHHLHTYEYRFQRNSKHVQGFPDMFNFGVSEQPREADLAKRLHEIILSHINPDSANPADQVLFRNLVLVGHDFDADLRYLESIGTKPRGDYFTFRGIIDSQDMHQVSRDLPQGRSLATVLNDLDIQHRYLHNAGNDAVYTLQAVLGLAVEARLEEVRQIDELERELGPDMTTANAAALQRADVLRDFDEAQRKKRRPGETYAEWSLRYYGY